MSILDVHKPFLLVHVFEIKAKWFTDLTLKALSVTYLTLKSCGQHVLHIFDIKAMCFTSLTLKLCASHL